MIGQVSGQVPNIYDIPAIHCLSQYLKIHKTLAKILYSVFFFDSSCCLFILVFFAGQAECFETIPP